jgi:quercetin dioxygenase-like cupin family protein
MSPSSRHTPEVPMSSQSRSSQPPGAQIPGSDSGSARHLENEARVLSFRREQVGPGVHVAHVGLRRGETSLPHFHPRTRDTFYVISGQLTVTLRVDSSVKAAAYRHLCATAPDVQNETAGREIHKIRVLPGEVLTVEPNVIHCAANLDPDPCLFLCVEGVGEYEFIEADFK